MKKQMRFKLLAFVIVLFIVMGGCTYKIVKTSDVTNKKSEQEKVEDYAEKMKPKIKEKLKKEDIHHFIKDIKFNEKVTISPMGMIEVTGYINNEPEKFSFDASLYYKSNEVDSIGYSKEVGDRFTDWSEYTKKEKEEYIKTAYPDKKEREQYLRDIGELK
ncbi:DUF1433 domain-containing protein [Bacillus stercoris]|uniref:DUF1433 domain-containing protein n=1 Tax=Bacillus stercoris TaxID=2054641 RepID=UPI002DB8797B|nr:DUF1433 domain-containing protein [Bacillus stercoris]MEC2061518.1 DUF1433 domain-containing protein [Bacillus stercoris]